MNSRATALLLESSQHRGSAALCSRPFSVTAHVTTMPVALGNMYACWTLCCALSAAEILVSGGTCCGRCSH